MNTDKQARRGRMRQPATADSGATIWQRTFHELKFLVYTQTKSCIEAGRLPKNKVMIIL